MKYPPLDLASLHIQTSILMTTAVHFAACALKRVPCSPKKNEERRRHDSAMLGCGTTGDAMWDSFARNTENAKVFYL